ncbi:hypothetical protein OEZ85_004346 [Tetradesmus obliquus]|uniref:inositol-1,3,4-trisphosphate 5/6-kinase n=1 Tax=Tetradesmus obliquus TaxID=3088 RepID=A0ABY8UNY9_TETOB|nr:hypothetical protein OEZ85_004346 [Tetradesmus obliquus]
MIQAVAFVGSEPAGAVARLQRGGVRACIVASPEAADAAIKCVLIDAIIIIILQGGSHPCSSDQVMQALVQHNRRHILAAAAAAAASPTAAEQQQQQQQQQRPAVLVGWLRQQQQAHVAVVDPFENTAKVLDRLVLGQLLDELQQLRLPPGVAARAPRYCQVEDYAAVGLPALLAQHGMQPPFIVKPAVACGVAHSHSMALALTPGALASLAGRLPLPGLVCEFVNHGGLQHKVYVLGDKVFVTPRASIPDVHSSPDLPPEQQLLLFDSLASLPTQLPPHFVQQHSSSTCMQEQRESSSGVAGAQQQQQQQQQLNMQAVEEIAAFLRARLGLTLFGFDVVLASHQKAGSNTISSTEVAEQAQQQQQQELVVIDVNYFPNYGGGSNTPALFREALLQRWQQHTAGLVGK